MKVLLVAPPIMDTLDGRLQVVGVDAIRECPPLGIYTLAAVLEAEGHDVVVADLILHVTRSLDAFAADVDAADLVGIGATSMAWPTAVDTIAQVRRRRPEVPIVCGGIHPTLFDRHVLRTFPVQYVVRGEGEIALGRLCAALDGRLDLGAVPNLSWIDADGRLVRNAIDAKIAARDLAATPLPAWDRLPPATYKCLAVESSRGCAFDCSFCSTPYRRSWRGLDAEAVVTRLEHALERLDRTRSGCVHIVDDEFSMNPARATAIARRIAERGLTPRLLFDSRAPDLLHPDFVPANRAIHGRPPGRGRVRLRRGAGEGGARAPRAGRSSRRRGCSPSTASPPAPTSRSSSACPGRRAPRSSRRSASRRTCSSTTAST